MKQCWIYVVQTFATHQPRKTMNSDSIFSQGIRFRTLTMAQKLEQVKFKKKNTPKRSRKQNQRTSGRCRKAFTRSRTGTVTTYQTDKILCNPCQFGATIMAATLVAVSLFFESGSKQGCGSVFIWSGSSILGWIPIRIRIQGFDDQNWKKCSAGKKSSTLKHEISKFYILLLVIYTLQGPDPLTRLNPDLIRIRISNPRSKYFSNSLRFNADVYKIFCSFFQP